MKPFWKMPCFYLAIIGSIITGLQMYPSLLPPGRLMDLSHVTMGVILLIAAWSRGLRPDPQDTAKRLPLPDDDKTPLGGGTALLFAMGAGLVWVFMASGCATLKQIALDCGAPALVSASETAVEGLAADLMAWQTPSQEEWKLRALLMASKFGAEAIQCAARHLLGDAGTVAGPMQARCHSVGADAVPYLRYVASGGFK